MYKYKLAVQNIYRGEGLIWQNGCIFKLNSPELRTFVDCWRDLEHNGGEKHKVVEDRNERYDVAIIDLLEVSFFDLRADLSLLT